MKFQRNPATLSLIAICAAVWVAELTIPGLIDDLALAPSLGVSQPWRWLTSAFTHSLSPMHIMFNMMALWMVGQGLEHFLGWRRFLSVYLLSALGGSVLFVALATPPTAMNPLGSNWNVGLVGASGAVFGLFGALAVAQRRLGANTSQLWGVLAINAVISFVIPGIAWQAHIGGFLTGLAAMALLFWTLERSVKERKKLPWWPSLAALGLALVALVAVKYLFYA
ncbi:rhomboid family intramembrane serine protease [Aestuariimicrobium ganziense]|uniref:rhomboid family intramembrane serine protease n=1 Tax=Aestuariimicrobium ganziense TaxID=2773677 RepID=UPI001940A837|nr:rhomboid family intramembrane serine protease [Aestuariimicrobium ganziense]